MYATPATGSSQNANELEDYLLGKKRVDKILIGTENEKASRIIVSTHCFRTHFEPLGWSFPQEFHRDTVCEYRSRYRGQNS